MAKTIKASELPGMVGQEFEPSPWIEITQERVNLFADATNDHQFIHVDPDKAAKHRLAARSRTVSCRCRCCRT